MTPRRTFLALLCAVPGLALMAGCDGGNPQPPAGGFKGVDITGANYAKALSLPDTQGKLRSIAEFKGKAVVVFFGYTQCPDVCPTTMAELAQVKKLLGPEGEKLQPLFVTIDPERDTPELLANYMANFGPGFIALRGTVEETQAAATSFKAFFSKIKGKDPSSYTMDHTAGAYVFDPQGRIRLFVRYGQPIEAWVSDLKQIMMP